MNFLINHFMAYNSSVQIKVLQVSMNYMNDTELEQYNNSLEELKSVLKIENTKRLKQSLLKLSFDTNNSKASITAPNNSSTNAPKSRKPSIDVDSVFSAASAAAAKSYHSRAPSSSKDSVEFEALDQFAAENSSVWLSSQISQNTSEIEQENDEQAGNKLFSVTKGNNHSKNHGEKIVEKVDFVNLRSRGGRSMKLPSGAIPASLKRQSIM
jgi:hypothetical protein